MPDVPDKILQSDVYEKLQRKILASQSIKDREGIWSELEKVVLESFPRFVKYLNLLTAGRQTTIDLHTALLIKCGFKPSQMMILFGVTNGTINSRRESLCIRALGEKKSVKVIDGVIRLL